MKWSARAKTLLPALITTASVAGAKGALPILNNLALRADESGRLYVIGTDLETELETSAAVTVAAPGVVTVGARRLLDLIKGFDPDTEIRAERDGDHLKIQAGNGRYRLATLPFENFPVFDHSKPLGDVVIDAALLAKLLDKTGFAMAKADVRYYLNGLSLQAEASEFRAVSSDGHRLAVCTSGVAAGLDRASIVPRRAVLELGRLAAAAAGDVTLTLAENMITARIGGVRMSSKLIEGRFPDYQRVMPRELVRKVVINRDALVKALGRAILLSQENYKSVVVRTIHGGLEIKATNPEAEEAVETVDAELTGLAFEVGFNGAYLVDALGKLESEKAILELTDGCNSCLISDQADESFKFVVMPIL